MSLIYLSSALFTRAERDFNREIGQALRAAGHEVFLPQDLDHLDDQEAVFRANVAAVRAADLIVAVLDGTDVDSGVAWEMGMAHAQGIPIIGLRTDMRSRAETKDASINLMLHFCLARYVAEGRNPIPALVQAVNEFQARKARG